MARHDNPLTISTDQCKTSNLQTEREKRKIHQELNHLIGRAVIMDDLNDTQLESWTSTKAHSTWSNSCRLITQLQSPIWPTQVGSYSVTSTQIPNRIGLKLEQHVTNWEGIVRGTDHSKSKGITSPKSIWNLKVLKGVGLLGAPVPIKPKGRKTS